MPLYKYQCRACNLVEERISGIDDKILVCTECGELMDRTISQDEAFDYYWQPSIEEECG
jgi:putative FmdB family regulatory protein